MTLITPKREEVTAAKQAFGQWFPVHGALATPRHSLYVGLHKALEREHLQRHDLVTLGNALKTTLKQRPREEVKKVVETAEAIHDVHGLNTALAYLRGELQFTAPGIAPTARIDKAAEPISTEDARVLRKIIALKKLSSGYKTPKPSVLVHEFRKLLSGKGKVKPEKVRGIMQRRAARHETVLNRQTAKLATFRLIEDVIDNFSEKAKLPVAHAEKILLPLYDITNENDSHIGPVYLLNTALKNPSLSNQFNDKKTTKQLVSALEKSINQVKASNLPKRDWGKLSLLERVLSRLPKWPEQKEMTIDEFQKILQAETAAYIAEYKRDKP